VAPRSDPDPFTRLAGCIPNEAAIARYGQFPLKQLIGIAFPRATKMIRRFGSLAASPGIYGLRPSGRLRAQVSGASRKAESPSCRPNSRNHFRMTVAVGRWDAVDARGSCPNHCARKVDERADLAVADHPEVKSCTHGSATLAASNEVGVPVTSGSA
jgi:hypothetical protein